MNVRQVSFLVCWGIVGAVVSVGAPLPVFADEALVQLSLLLPSVERPQPFMATPPSDGGLLRHPERLPRPAEGDAGAAPNPAEGKSVHETTQEEITSTLTPSVVIERSSGLKERALEIPTSSQPAPILHMTPDGSRRLPTAPLIVTQGDTGGGAIVFPSRRAGFERLRRTLQYGVVHHPVVRYLTEEPID